MEGIFDGKDKNLFPIGGFMPIDIPAVFRGVGKKLRDRMYRTIRPEEYSLEQVENFVKGTPRQYYRNPNAESNAYRVVDDFNGRRGILDPLDSRNAHRASIFGLDFNQTKSLWNMGYNKGGKLRKRR
jgi:hypothetical protein